MREGRGGRGEWRSGSIGEREGRKVEEGGRGVRVRSKGGVASETLFSLPDRLGRGLHDDEPRRESQAPCGRTQGIRDWRVFSVGISTKLS